MEFGRSRDERDARGGRPQNRENRERIPIRGQHFNSSYQSIPLRPAHPQRYPSSNTNFDHSPSYWRPESSSNLPPRPMQRYRSPPPAQLPNPPQRNWEGRSRERDGRGYGREESIAPRTEPRIGSWRDTESSRSERENRDRRPSYQDSRGRSSFDIPYRVTQSSKRPRSSSEDEDSYPSNRGRSRASSVEYRSRNSTRPADPPRRMLDSNITKPSYGRLEERLRKPPSPTPSDKSNYDSQSRDHKEGLENRLSLRTTRRSYSPGEISEGPTRSVSPQSRSHSTSLPTEPRSRSRTRTPVGSRERSGTPPLSLRSEARSEEDSLLKRMDMGDLRNEREMEESSNDSLEQQRQASEAPITPTLSNLSPLLPNSLLPNPKAATPPPSLALRLSAPTQTHSIGVSTLPTALPSPPTILSPILVQESTPPPQPTPAPNTTELAHSTQLVTELPPTSIPSILEVSIPPSPPSVVSSAIESLPPFDPPPVSPPAAAIEDIEMKSSDKSPVVPSPTNLPLPLPTLSPPVLVSHAPLLSPPSPPPSPPIQPVPVLDLDEKMDITMEAQTELVTASALSNPPTINFSAVLSGFIVANSEDDGLVNSIIISNRVHTNASSLHPDLPMTQAIENSDWLEENAVKLLPFLLDSFKTRDDRRVEKIMSLRREYKDLNVDWMGHCKRLEKVKTKNSRRASGTGVDENGVPFYSEATSAVIPSISAALGAGGGRANRRNPNYGYGDAVRSEAEFLEILASLENADMQDPGMRATRTAAIVPDMVVDSDERIELNLFDDRRRLVEDPTEFYELGKPIEIWTEEEVQKFCKAFSIYPKQFGKISAEVEEKTTAECVRFYYRMKTTIDFRSLSDRRGRDGRRRKLRRRGEEGGKGSLMSNLKRGREEEEEEEYEEEKVVEKKTPKLKDSSTLSVPSTSASTPNSIHPPSDSMLEAAETLGALFSNSGNDEDKKRRKSNTSSSYWSVAERNNFVRLLGVHGKDWGKLAIELESKTAVQCRNWFQNHSKKLNLSDIVKSVPGGNAFADDRDDDSGSGAVTPVIEYTAPLGIPLSESFGNGTAVPQAGFFSSDSQPPTQRITSGKGILSLLNEDDRLVDERGGKADGEDWFGGGGLEETEDEAEFVKKDITIYNGRQRAHSASSPKKEYGRLPSNPEHYPILYPHPSPIPQPLHSWQPRPVQFNSPYNHPSYPPNPPSNGINRIRSNSGNPPNGDFLRRSEGSTHLSRRDIYPPSQPPAHLPMPLPVTLPVRHHFSSQGKTIYDRNGFQPRTGYNGPYGNGGGWQPPPESNGNGHSARR